MSVQDIARQGGTDYYLQRSLDSDRAFKVSPEHPDIAAYIARREGETLDWLERQTELLPICQHFDIKPSRITDMLKGVDRSDEMAVDYAIRDGIRATAPSLINEAHHFIRVCYRPADFAMAAE